MLPTKQTYNTYKFNTKTNVQQSLVTLISTFSRCCKSKSGFNHWLLHFFQVNLVLMNFDELWWTLMKFYEIWWSLMKNRVFIKFHQISSKFIFFRTLIFLMKFDEIWWKSMFHQNSSNFIKVHFFFKTLIFWWNLIKFDEIWWKQFFFKTLILLMNFDEIWWNLMKTMFSSNFTKVQFLFSKPWFFWWAC